MAQGSSRFWSKIREENQTKGGGGGGRGFTSPLFLVAGMPRASVVEQPQTPDSAAWWQLALCRGLSHSQSTGGEELGRVPSDQGAGSPGKAQSSPNLQRRALWVKWLLSTCAGHFIIHQSIFKDWLYLILPISLHGRYSPHFIIDKGEAQRG